MSPSDCEYLLATTAVPNLSPSNPGASKENRTRFMELPDCEYLLDGKTIPNLSPSTPGTSKENRSRYMEPYLVPETSYPGFGEVPQLATYLTCHYLGEKVRVFPKSLRGSHQKFICDCNPQTPARDSGAEALVEEDEARREQKGISKASRVPEDHYFVDWATLPAGSNSKRSSPVRASKMNRVILRSASLPTNALQKPNMGDYKKITASHHLIPSSLEKSALAGNSHKPRTLHPKQKALSQEHLMSSSPEKLTSANNVQKTKKFTPNRNSIYHHLTSSSPKKCSRQKAQKSDHFTLEQRAISHNITPASLSKNDKAPGNMKSTLFSTTFYRRSQRSRGLPVFVSCRKSLKAHVNSNRTQKGFITAETALLEQIPHGNILVTAESGEEAHLDLVCEESAPQGLPSSRSFQTGSDNDNDVIWSQDSEKLKKNLVNSENVQRSLISGANGLRNIVSSENVQKNLVCSENVQQSLVNGGNSKRILVDSKNVQKSVINGENSKGNLVYGENVLQNLVSSESNEKNLVNSENVQLSLISGANGPGILVNSENSQKNLTSNKTVKTNSIQNEYARGNSHDYENDQINSTSSHANMRIDSTSSGNVGIDSSRSRNARINSSIKESVRRNPNNTAVRNPASHRGTQSETERVGEGRPTPEHEICESVKTRPKSVKSDQMNEITNESALMKVVSGENVKINSLTSTEYNEKMRSVGDNVPVTTMTHDSERIRASSENGKNSQLVSPKSESNLMIPENNDTDRNKSLQNEDLPKFPSPIAKGIDEDENVQPLEDFRQTQALGDDLHSVIKSGTTEKNHFSPRQIQTGPGEVLENHSNSQDKDLMIDSPDSETVKKNLGSDENVQQSLFGGDNGQRNLAYNENIQTNVVSSEIIKINLLKNENIQENCENVPHANLKRAENEPNPKNISCQKTQGGENFKENVISSFSKCKTCRHHNSNASTYRSSDTASTSPSSRYSYEYYAEQHPMSGVPRDSHEFYEHLKKNKIFTPSGSKLPYRCISRQFSICPAEPGTSIYQGKVTSNGNKGRGNQLVCDYINLHSKSLEAEDSTLEEHGRFVSTGQQCRSDNAFRKTAQGKVKPFCSVLHRLNVSFARQNNKKPNYHPGAHEENKKIPKTTETDPNLKTPSHLDVMKSNREFLLKLAECEKYAAETSSHIASGAQHIKTNRILHEVSSFLIWDYASNLCRKRNSRTNSSSTTVVLDQGGIPP